MKYQLNFHRDMLNPCWGFFKLSYGSAGTTYCLRVGRWALSLARYKEQA